jgi:hypothetical protein
MIGPPPLPVLPLSQLLMLPQPLLLLLLLPLLLLLLLPLLLLLTPLAKCCCRCLFCSAAKTSRTARQYASRLIRPGHRSAIRIQINLPRTRIMGSKLTKILKLHTKEQCFGSGSGTDPKLGYRIRIRIHAGQNYPQKNCKNKEILCLKSFPWNWRLSLEPKCPLKVGGNEKQWGLGRSQMLGNGLGPWRSRFIFYLNMQLLN